MEYGFLHEVSISEGFIEFVGCPVTLRMCRTTQSESGAGAAWNFDCH